MSPLVPLVPSSLLSLCPSLFPSVSGQTLEDEIADLSEKLDVCHHGNGTFTITSSSPQQTTQRSISAVRASVGERVLGDRFEEVMSVSSPQTKSGACGLETRYLCYPGCNLSLTP